ncbi:Chalcone isomerase-like [Polynucleobacter meluiroseus]|uniref:Chalcone isomerase-like n=1 Tax=Polynucleobacter meluiroseus TaxID=1938814 RepID=A0A240DY35_9BURK|nr:chalcone isomerase family protein [Polynucleobacter meluiroseus]SNX28105.1 Chalcone isomerase-like [Polynucleobacter meluiroseus]
MSIPKQLLAIALLAISMTISAEPLHLATETQSLGLQGAGKLTFFGLHIYDAAFYRGVKNSATDFALDVRYQKSLSGTTIANRAAEEMKKQGVAEPQAANWGKQMAGFFPNVEPGQSLTAIYSATQGTTFLFEGKKIAVVPGNDFAKAFFGIWLDSNTSVPKLRASLLGQGCPPPLIGEGC